MPHMSKAEMKVLGKRDYSRQRLKNFPIGSYFEAQKWLILNCIVPNIAIDLISVIEWPKL